MHALQEDLVVSSVAPLLGSTSVLDGRYTLSLAAPTRYTHAPGDEVNTAAWTHPPASLPSSMLPLSRRPYALKCGSSAMLSYMRCSRIDLSSTQKVPTSHCHPHRIPAPIPSPPRYPHFHPRPRPIRISTPGPFASASTSPPHPSIHLNPNPTPIPLSHPIPSLPTATPYTLCACLIDTLLLTERHAFSKPRVLLCAPSQHQTCCAGQG